MDAFRLETPVFVATGYMDCQCIPHGYAGVIVGERDGQYLVRDSQGDVSTCAPEELQRIAAPDPMRDLN